MEAISHAGTVLGVLSKGGVVLAAEKKVTGKLLDMSGAKEGGYGGSGEKIFLLNSCAHRSDRARRSSLTSHISRCASGMWWRVLLGSRRMRIRSSTTRDKPRNDTCSCITRISP